MQKVCRTKRCGRPSFANSQIFDGMTLGIFTISTSWKAVTLGHGNFRKPTMSILPVFTLKQNLPDSQKSAHFSYQVF